MEKIIYSAEFDSKLVTYNVVAMLIALVISCFGLFLAPIPSTWNAISRVSNFG